MGKPCTRDILSNLLLALFISAFVVAPVRLVAEEALPAGRNATAPDGVKGADSAGGIEMKGGETLSLDRCIEIALRKSPTILAAYHAVNAGQSRVGQARSGYYPQIAASADYSKYSLSTDPTNAALDQYAATATLTQNIFDFGKTWTQVTIQQRNLDASRETSGTPPARSSSTSSARITDSSRPGKTAMCSRKRWRSSSSISIRPKVSSSSASNPHFLLLFSFFQN